MEFKKLQTKPEFALDKKLNERLEGFKSLISELQKKDIPAEPLHTVNAAIDEINGFSGTGKKMLQLLRKKQAEIIKMLEKELKLVTKNHYRNLWLALGMSAFGIPAGVAIGISAGNMGLLGIGLPIGMGIGLAVGTAMDKKAKALGNQLDVDLKY
jgi:zinc transporter ZupT